jgi:Zn-dependent oligopeptidase
VEDWYEYRFTHPGFLARAKELGEPVYESYLKWAKSGPKRLSDQLTYSRYAGFLLDGAYLPAAKKARMFAVLRRLNRARSGFVRNAMRVRDSVQLRVTDASELEGLSPEAIERARKYGEKEGIFLIPVSDKLLIGEIQTYAHSRTLRRKLWYSKTPKEVASLYLTPEEAGEAWNHVNEPLLQEIAALNQEYASILGHPNFASYQLQMQMVPGPKGVQKFFDELIPKVLRSAKAERKELEQFARKLDRIDRLEEWDVPYYRQKLMKETFGFDDRDLSEYFELDQTLSNMLKYAEKRFPIRFQVKEGAPSYHPDNMVYEVFDTRTGKKISEIHLDPLRRDGKQPFQGWEYLFRSRGAGSQGDLPAVMAVSMNIEPAENGKPVLLDFEKGVQLAFHEFVGHALHESSDVSKIPGIAGTQGVFADGVETPSMIAEEFARDPLFLRMATHHRTGKPLPEKWIRTIINELPKFHRGLDLLAGYRALSKAYLDFHYGFDPPKAGESFIEYEKRKLGPLNLFPHSPYAPVGQEFLHHFGGGMECLYFSYLTGAVKGAFVAEFLFRQEYNQPMKFMNYWDHVLAPSGKEADINFLIEQFTGEGITLYPYFQRYGF